MTRVMACYPVPLGMTSAFALNDELSSLAVDSPTVVDSR
jgi:hypothetical protein